MNRNQQTTEAFSNDYDRALPGHYRLIELLGRGGMAEVYLAEDQRLSRRVAIKFLNSEFRRDADRMRRFKQEARSASALNHPNILTIHDIGEGEGVQFIVSEFVEGETLSSRIGRGTIPIPEAIEIAMQVASALAASHKAGIVHRDMKPENVMIRRDGNVKVLDFGLAKDTGEVFSRSGDHDASTIDRVSTSPGLIMGTPQYMSPEQARGHRLDGRTDIFSLGMILFEMVTGRPPFAGNTTADLIVAIVSKEPQRLEQYVSDPPLSLIRIVQKTLRKDREERYSTMDHLLSDLKDLKRELAADPAFNETADNPKRTTAHNTLPSVVVSHRTFYYAALALVAVGTIALLAWWYAYRPTSADRETAGTMRAIPITSWSSGVGEISSAASFSPDARMITFAANKSGATEIFVKPTAGGDAIQVTKNGFHNQNPIWSPNGQDIAFFSRRQGNNAIWRAAFTGGQETKVLAVTGFARPVRWADDGKLYFQEGREIFAVNVNTNERMQITNFAETGEIPKTIEISPGGSAVAYTILDKDRWKIKTRRIGSEGSEIVADSKYQIDFVAWRPNGIIIFSGSVDGAYQIFEARPGKDAVQLSNGNQDLFVHDVSADGSNILYGSVAETSDLWKVNVADSSVSLVSNEVESEYWPDVSPDSKSVVFQSVAQAERPYDGPIVAKSMGGNSLALSQQGFAPVWSPDGRWIAYFKRTDAGIEIWRVKATGDDALKLSGEEVDPPGYTVSPYLKFGANVSWSPDGGRLAFVSRANGASNVWAVNMDGTGNVQLTENEDSRERYCCLLWLPDGKHLVATAFGSASGSRITLLDLEGAEQRIVYEARPPFRVLGMSESGREIVFAQRGNPADSSATPASIDVYSLSLQPGDQLKKVGSLLNAYFYNIHLSRDGKSIAFVSNLNGVTSVRTVPVKEATPKELLNERDPKVMISSLAWSPDGRAIVFGKQTRTHLLSMLSK